MSVTSVSSDTQKTIQQIIDQNSSKTSDRNTGELGKDDFLSLLVTQLRYQDPLSPTDNKEFIGQMAQFSSLEQMQNLNTSFTATKAFSLIGKTVNATITNASNETEQISGNVTNVKLSAGKYYIVVNGTDVPIDNVTEVSDSSTSLSNISAYTSLIGHTVNAIAYDADSGDMLKVTGTVNSIVKGTYEDYALMDGADVEIAGINTSETSTDPNFVKNTLQDACDNKKEISIIIKDSATGKKVPVTVTISKLDFSNDKITATVNGLTVPVLGITKISGSTASQAGE